MIELDKTEIFTKIKLFPIIKAQGEGKAPSITEARIHRALKSAQKYSLVANSIKSEVIIDPVIEIIQ